MKDQAIVVLDDNIAPKGYAYLLVNQGLWNNGNGSL